MTDAGLTWTDERVELLKKLWTDGLSASQIATELGNVTRNAVIGKVHRLGLSGRAKDKAAAPQRPRKVARAPSPPVAIPPQSRTTAPTSPPRPAMTREEPHALVRDSEIGLPTSERVTIMELRESMCRWPMGDPTKAEFRFCGGGAVNGLPYCDHHARIAYQPVADRKRERKFARG